MSQFNAQPNWLALAWADLGVAETPGSKHTARIVGYYADVGHPQITDDETAWCAAFAGSCLERAGIGSTRSLMARSYLDWGDGIETFAFGAIAVLSRGADPTLGHVGFLIGETPDGIVLLGGNQSDAVTVEAFPRSRLLGVRWPIQAAVDPAAPAPQRDETADLALFERALAHVLAMEGGWTDDPYDPGGPTNYGITLATYARERGIQVTAGNIAALTADLKDITPATVRRIYLQRYWHPACCPLMPHALAFFHFDAAVNQGVTGSARLLQQAVGAAIDGEIGPETLGKAAARPMAEVLALYAEARRQHYRSLSTFWRFGRGWLARVERTLAAATTLAATTGSSPGPSGPVPQPKETISMANETTQVPQTPDVEPTSKWWDQSMTVWGVLITALSTVLPAVGPLIGLDITADLVSQLGDQIVIVVQAIGGLVGTVLAIWGRARATAPLDRKLSKTT